jgi:hypothetical protein
MSLAVEMPAQSTFRGRHPGIHNLTHDAASATTTNQPEQT